MRVLLVSDYGNAAGGAELQLHMLREELRKRGHEARLFASSALPGDSPTVADDHCFGTTSGFRTLLQTYNPSASVRLRQVVSAFRPDVVHVCLFLTQLSPSILAILRSTPSLYHAVWYRSVCPLGTKMWPDGKPCDAHWGAPCLRRGCTPLRDWLPLMVQMRWWRGRQNVFRMVVANSEATRALLRAGGMHAEEVVWPGIPQHPASRPLSQEPTVVFAGRLVREKGADVLVRAFESVSRQLPSSRLVLAGEGPERRSLEALIVDLGLADRVRMIGALPSESLPEAFRGAWVQAVPSRWPEPFGMVAAEAMMRSTAVVASDTGGLPEVVSHGRTGRLVPPGDARALAAALLDLLRDRAVADRMGSAGREMASSRFGIDGHVERFLRLYQRIASGPVAAPGAE